jgi:elongation factor Ts
MPQDLLDKEREIFVAQARESGKPENIIEKMVSGRMNKFLAENTLLGQAFVKDTDITVEKLLKSRDASVAQFQRFEVGEGIEKKKENFAEEVRAQAKV